MTIYISVDVETNGPIPGPNSMLSIGAAAFRDDGKLHSTFSRNLEELPDSKADPKTAEWWKTQPEAWAACRSDLCDPRQGMLDFVRWVQDFKSPPVFVAYPAGFDFTFVYWYMIRFVGESPFSFSAVDIKTLAWAALGGEYRKATKRNFPKQWFSNTPHNHIAVDDAVEQGQLFFSILKELKNMKRE